MHRTKCTAMINSVLAPYFIKRLVSDIGDSKYSLLLDESTDLSVSKYLGIVVRYFCEVKRNVMATYLGLVELEGGDALVDSQSSSSWEVWPQEGELAWHRHR